MADSTTAATREESLTTNEAIATATAISLYMSELRARLDECRYSDVDRLRSDADRLRELESAHVKILKMAY